MNAHGASSAAAGLGQGPAAGRILRDDARETDGVWELPEDRARIGIVTWVPAD